MKVSVPFQKMNEHSEWKMDVDNFFIKKRVRDQPNKMWKPWEEKLLIEFLKENWEFEMPTANLFYSRFLKENQVIADWKTVRSKVRNMRTCYKKAKAWERSTDAGCMGDGENLKKTLVKMCSFFDDFEYIFGFRSLNSAEVSESSDSNSRKWASFINVACGVKGSINVQTVGTETAADSAETDSVSAENISISTKTAENTAGRKDTYSQTAVSEILSLQSEVTALQKNKMEAYLEYKEREMEIRERETKVKETEIELRRGEMELKRMEFLSQEMLKIKELEMKERIAMRKLELKFK